MVECPSCRHANDEDAKFCQECGVSLAGRSQEQRKTVTVVFCDLAGSTALGETLDPERLRTLLAGYFEGMKAIVERHGGTVEKFIGDAVMAVFGVPTLHEDDALRAVRAAAEMRGALPGLGLQGRIGVMTGEVVTGTQERLVTGDAVNVAARLEQAAQPGEVLMGEPTLALVRDSVDVEPLEPLALKGKAEPVPAYRLLRVGDVPERRHDTPFVGREHQLALVREAWERVQVEERCELITVVGDAGVGKSRLAAEFLIPLEATILRGRCLPYGEGITHWPVVEVLKQLDVLPADPTAAAAIRSVLGQSDAPTSTEEIAWAFRKTLEQAATERPLVVVLDDIQWGEETFLDLIEHVALLSSGAPILLLCMARPELGENRPSWPVTLRLEPLGADDVETLIPERIPGGLRRRIARAAGGNPLFITEMLAVARDADGDVVVPPTLQALLATRLGQLEPAERSVLERGAIEGEIFHRGAVQGLAPEETHLTPRLAALVRKQLITPERAMLQGDDGFRFRHLLLRDAAYEGLPKAVRADLHERFATWLEEHGEELVERDEILGYHLEQACRYREGLGLPADDVAVAARRHLTAGGQRAARHQDYDAAVNLFGRAAALVPPGEVDLALESEFGQALLWLARTDDALQRADAFAQRASVAGDRRAELCGMIQGGVLRLYLEAGATSESVTRLVEQALPVFRAAGDDLALYIGYSALGEAADLQGQIDAALDAHEQAIAHARRVGHEPASLLGTLAYLRFIGRTPVAELLAWLDDHEPHTSPDQFFRAYRAWSLAKLGRFDEARTILAQAREEQAERGGGILLANLTAFESVSVELLAGDPAAAVEFGLEGCRLHEELGQPRFVAAAGGSLARALYALDRLEDVDAWTGRAAGFAATDDVWTQMVWRQLKAKVLARRGEHAEAERLARKAVAIGDGTDMLDLQGDVHANLAEVLLLGGKPDEAAAALEQALERYEGKGNLVSAGCARARLTELRA